MSRKMVCSACDPPAEGNFFEAGAALMTASVRLFQLRQQLPKRDKARREQLRQHHLVIRTRVLELSGDGKTKARRRKICQHCGGASLTTAEHTCGYCFLRADALTILQITPAHSHYNGSSKHRAGELVIVEAAVKAVNKQTAMLGERQNYLNDLGGRINGLIRKLKKPQTKTARAKLDGRYRSQMRRHRELGAALHESYVPYRRLVDYVRMADIVFDLGYDCCESLSCSADSCGPKGGAE